jgi:hypothetical protein
MLIIIRAFNYFIFNIFHHTLQMVLHYRSRVTANLSRLAVLPGLTTVLRRVN